MSIGANVKRLREARGWTQAELGYFSGYKRSSISNIERDEQDPTIAGLHALADAFSIDPAEILRESTQDNLIFRAEQHLQLTVNILSREVDRLRRELSFADQRFREASSTLKSFQDLRRRRIPVEKPVGLESATAQQPAPF